MGSSSIHIFFKRFFREVIKSAFTRLLINNVFIISHFFKNVKVSFFRRLSEVRIWDAFHKLKNILFLGVFIGKKGMIC